MQSPGAEDHAEHQEVAEQGHEDDEAVHAHDQVVLHLELLLQQGDSLARQGFYFTLLTSNSLQNMSGRVFTESSLLVSGECDEALLKVYLPCYYFCLVTTYFYIISLAVKI